MHSFFAKHKACGRKLPAGFSAGLQLVFFFFLFFCFAHHLSPNSISLSDLFGSDAVMLSRPARGLGWHSIHRWDSRRRRRRQPISDSVPFFLSSIIFIPGQTASSNIRSPSTDERRFTRRRETFHSAKQSTVRVASASSKQRRADATLLAKLLNPCPQGKRTQVSGWDSLLLFLSSGPASNNLLLPPPHL